MHFTASNRILFHPKTKIEKLRSLSTLGDRLEPLEVLNLPGVGDSCQGGVVAVRGNQTDGGH